MPHYFPKAPFITREPCDVDALNDNFQEIHNTLAALNEHNFDNDCLVNADDHWAEDIALRAHVTETSIDPHGSSNVDINGSGQWTPLSGGTKNVTVRGGKMLIVASFQIEMVLNTTTDREPGLMFALEIDGAVDAGALIGSADVSNDLIQHAFLPGTYNFPGLDLATAPALRGGFIPVVLERVVTLGEGVHTVSVVSRNIQALHTVNSQMVSQMMVLGLEMWA